MVVAGRSAENNRPVGDSLYWWNLVIHHVPRRAIHTARQLARLAKGELAVTTTWRSLEDAVQRADKAGHTRAYVQGGVDDLKRTGWLEVVTVGTKRGAKTTFRLVSACQAACEHTDGHRSRWAPDEPQATYGQKK